MARQPSEDLFESTSMTFGEHLEELRVCLIKALLGLCVGMVVGFFIADQVVLWIQSPLTKALNEYYADAAKLRLEKEYGTDVPKDMAALAAQQGMVFEEIYFEKQELQRLVDAADPGIGDAITAEEFAEKLLIPSANLIKTRLWRAARAELTVLSPQEAFMIWLRAAAVSGLIISSPWIFYQVWVFVAAGLYPHEKRYVYIYLPFSVVLFLAGAALAFYAVFGPVLDFLFSFAEWMEFAPDLRISEVISFVLVLPLGFGIAFQLPLVMLFVNRLGIVSVETYLEKWRIAILVIFVISMLLTPADPVSMLLMAIPLTGLYFLGVGLCKWMPQGRNPFQEAYEP